MDPLSSLENDLLARYRSRTAASAALYERATRVLPGGDTRTGTFYLPYPVFLERGQGARLWDADGNEYLDFLSNFTSLIHGHAHPRLVEAIAGQASRGTAHGSAGSLQVKLAEALAERMPSLERIRFCNSGTEATLSALRAAKAFTGKPLILKMEGGYHGSHDQVTVGLYPPFDARSGPGLSPGAASEVLLGSFNDLTGCSDLIRRHRDQLAAVIVEPVMGSAGCIPAEPGFLQGLREVTRECGVVLIFDEIITFRLSYGGAQEIHGIRPDLTCLGKVMGGGLPVGAFGGRADIMATYDPTRAGTIGHSGTYNGNAATMAAGIAALELLTRDAIERINRMGETVRASLRESLDRSGLDAVVSGTGSLAQVHFLTQPLSSARDAIRSDRRLVRLLHLSLLENGMFTASRQLYVLSTVMTADDLGRFTAAFAGAITTIAETAHQSAAL